MPGIFAALFSVLVCGLATEEVYGHRLVLRLKQGDTTLSISSFSIMTLNITTLSIITLCIMTLSITIKKYENQHKQHSAYFYFMLIVLMLGVAFFIVMLSAVAPLTKPPCIRCF